MRARGYIRISPTLQSRGHGLGESEVGVDAGAHPRGVVGAAALVGPERAAGLGKTKKKASGMGLEMPLFHCLGAERLGRRRWGEQGLRASPPGRAKPRKSREGWQRPGKRRARMQPSKHAQQGALSVCTSTRTLGPHQEAAVLGVGGQAEPQAHVVLPLGHVGQRDSSFGERSWLAGRSTPRCRGFFFLLSLLFLQQLSR